MNGIEVYFIDMDAGDEDPPRYFLSTFNPDELAALVMSVKSQSEPIDLPDIGGVRKFFSSNYQCIEDGTAFYAITIGKPD